MNGLIYRWRFADSQGYIKCGRKQEILETIWIAGHSKRKKSAAWVGIPAHSLSGSVFVGWWGPIFFFFLRDGSFQVVVGLWQGGCSWLSPALGPGLGAVLWQWWLLFLLPSQWSLGCSFLHLCLGFLPSASPTWERRSVLSLCPILLHSILRGLPCLLAAGLSGQHLAHLLQ